MRDARERDVHQLVKSRMEKNLHEGEWGCWEDRVTVFSWPGVYNEYGDIRAQSRRKSAMCRPGQVMLGGSAGRGVSVCAPWEGASATCCFLT